MIMICVACAKILQTEEELINIPIHTVQKLGTAQGVNRLWMHTYRALFVPPKTSRQKFPSASLALAYFSYFGSVRSPFGIYSQTLDLF